MTFIEKFIKNFVINFNHEKVKKNCNKIAKNLSKIDQKTIKS